MRKPRDAADTRERVLQAAEELFSAHGFAGTSLADIAQRSGISDGLILHHFQNKKNLYQQVLENLAARYSKVLFDAQRSAETPQAGMQNTLLSAFSFMKDVPAYHRMSLWAFLEGPNEFTQNEAAFTSEIAKQIQRLQQAGVIDSRYSPQVLLTMVIGPIHFWLRYREKFAAALDLPEDPETLDRQFVEQLTHILGEITQPLSPQEGHNG